ncbi:hypothetical protein ACHAW5_001618 [Stephanodiscus triporus]|uniref:Uncharacterized protein n=1 Tax=Stephanodiscus triporus TaxID=2934178 RepID=A0ABD3PZV3_9STRA
MATVKRRGRPQKRPRIFLLCWLPICLGLTPPPLARTSRPHTANRFPSHGNAPSTLTRLYGGNQFDITKPTFDLLSLRPIRSDALLRYNSLNQSEPLRINLYLLATISLLGYPLWCESVTGDVATSISTVASSAAGGGCAILFWRERTRRSNQLSRMEKELNAENLEVRMPVNVAISSARPMSRLKDLKGKRRILAIRGSKERLSGPVWNTLCLFRRRLVQSQTLVVLVPTDGGSQRVDWECDKNRLGGTALWLADALNIDGQGGWLSYFEELLDNGDGGGRDSIDEVAWFALNFNGRSIASGYGNAPRVLELLGQQLQPMELLDDTDEAELQEGVSAVTQILERQKKFYSVLTDSSDENDMRPLFSTNSVAEVDEVVDGGGRIDSWSKCLEPGSRPAGMKISGSDVWVASNTLAYSTCVEFPSNAGIDGATLLAVQRWGRASEDGDWKLELHQTIPWSAGSRAGGTLRCDHRGCVALARSPDKRTFGGLIG